MLETWNKMSLFNVNKPREKYLEKRLVYENDREINNVTMQNEESQHKTEIVYEEVVATAAAAAAAENC